MSVNSYLSEVASSLVLSPDEKAGIQTSLATLGTRLDNHFGGTLTTHFRFGSSTRDTMLPRWADDRSDIDYMVVFNTVLEGHLKPQTYLSRLKRFAEERYSSSEIAQSSPTIVLSLRHIRFELVPAVNDFGYMIPAPASSWMEWMYTDPAGSTTALQQKNVVENYRIKPLVRLIKYWNARKGHPFWSFELEREIVGKGFFGCSSLADYFYGFWSSFYAPFSARQYIKTYVDSAKKAASDAKIYESLGMTGAAEREIKKLVPER